MSIYNGFSTWKQEGTYLKTLYKLIVLVSNELSGFLTGDLEKPSNYSSEAPSIHRSNRIDSKFKKMLNVLSTLEIVKYQPPMFSMAFESIANTLNCNFDWKDS
jgi:hypothetical protein